MTFLEARVYGRYMGPNNREDVRFKLFYEDGTPVEFGGGEAVLDDDLTDIAALSPANDDFIQRKSGVWVNRTLAQVKTDLAIPYVTSLPGSPTDGDEIFYAADAANGVIWHLRYRAAASGSYKWEFLGGPELAADIVTMETTSSTSFVNLTTTGPTVTLPLAGDYDITTLCAMLNTSASVNCFMSYSIGASAAVDADGLFNIRQPEGTHSTRNAHIRVQRKTGLGAVALVGKYRVDAGSGQFSVRGLRARPIRVG